MLPVDRLTFLYFTLRLFEKVGTRLFAQSNWNQLVLKSDFHIFSQFPYFYHSHVENIQHLKGKLRRIMFSLDVLHHAAFPGFGDLGCHHWAIEAW